MRGPHPRELLDRTFLDREGNVQPWGKREEGLWGTLVPMTPFPARTLSKNGKSIAKIIPLVAEASFFFDRECVPSVQCDSLTSPFPPLPFLLFCTHRLSFSSPPVALRSENTVPKSPFALSPDATHTKVHLYISADQAARPVQPSSGARLCICRRPNSDLTRPSYQARPHSVHTALSANQVTKGCLHSRVCADPVSTTQKYNCHILDGY